VTIRQPTLAVRRTGVGSSRLDELIIALEFSLTDALSIPGKTSQEITE